MGIVFIILSIIAIRLLTIDGVNEFINQHNLNDLYCLLFASFASLGFYALFKDAIDVMFRRHTESNLRKHEERKRREREEYIRKGLHINSKLICSWAPSPWKDFTGTLHKTRAEAWAKFDEIKNQWNDDDVTLKMNWEKWILTWDIVMVPEKFLKALKRSKDFNFPIPIPRLPELLFQADKKTTVKFFYYEDAWYYTEENLDEDDVEALIEETYARKDRKLRRQIDKAKRMQPDISESFPREKLSEGVQNSVWTRDGGKCVQCGSRRNLEFDHIIPVSKGGGNTARNIQLLCEKCNREKGSKIGG